MASRESLSEMLLLVVLEVVGTANYLRFESLCRMNQPFAGPELSTPSLCDTNKYLRLAGSRIKIVHTVFSLLLHEHFPELGYTRQIPHLSH